MARKESVFWLFCTLALMMSVVLVDAQTFFTNGRYGKRSEVRSRGILHPFLFQIFSMFLDFINFCWNAMRMMEGV
jgi:hypothetical protein